jgi:hypothetical protein
MPSLVQFLQIVSGLAWLLPTLIMAPGIVRVWRGRGDSIDAMRGPVFFIGIVQIGFTIRWLIWPHAIPVMGATELSTWAGLYVLSIMCAVGIACANRFAERLR